MVTALPHPAITPTVKPTCPPTMLSWTPMPAHASTNPQPPTVLAWMHLMQQGVTFSPRLSVLAGACWLPCCSSALMLLFASSCMRRCCSPNCNRLHACLDSLPGWCSLKLTANDRGTIDLLWKSEAHSRHQPAFVTTSACSNCSAPDTIYCNYL